MFSIFLLFLTTLFPLTSGFPESLQAKLDGIVPAVVQQTCKSGALLKVGDKQAWLAKSNYTKFHLDAKFNIAIRPGDIIEVGVGVGVGVREYMKIAPSFQGWVVSFVKALLSTFQG